ncbi:hypothetical protein D5S17_12280 [Pseudonocardiaceae bacterium YIM PH 21723]|nr:hypothetical protein D5S17_12280 [Pseudonocardiaceae bacterium YIM PH 21723]
MIDRRRGVFGAVIYVIMLLRCFVSQLGAMPISGYLWIPIGREWVLTAEAVLVVVILVLTVLVCWTPLGVTGFGRWAGAVLGVLLVGSVVLRAVSVPVALITGEPPIGVAGILLVNSPLPGFTDPGLGLIGILLVRRRFAASSD